MINQVLAQLYGTGIEKTASEEEVEELDLSEISAADFIAGVEAGEIEFEDGEDIEKEAEEDDIDLSKLSGSELVALLEEVEGAEEQEKTAAVLEKMAHDGELDYWDTAGRILAHAYQDEMSKVAGDDLPGEIDIDDIDGETMVSLLESGEYELVEDEDDEDDIEKEAMPAWMRRAGKAVGHAYKGTRISAGRRSLRQAKKARTAAEAAKKMGQAPGKKKHLKELYGEIAAKRTGSAKKLRRKGWKSIARGGAETGAAYGIPAAAIGYGGYRAGKGKK